MVFMPAAPCIFSYFLRQIPALGNGERKYKCTEHAELPVFGTVHMKNEIWILFINNSVLTLVGMH